MQLKITTDYAIRIVFYTAMMSEKDRLVSSGEMSEKLGIPKSIVLKEGAKLKEAGIINIKSGVTGGFSLRKKPEEISLLEIIDLFEPTTKINRCLEEDRYCSRFAVDDCPVRKAYVNIQKLIEERLKGISILDILNGNEESNAVTA